MKLLTTKPFVAVLAVGAVAPVLANVSQTAWTSTGANIITPGTVLNSAYDPNVNFAFYSNGDIGIEISGAAFNGRYPQTAGVVDPANPLQIQLSPDGYIYVKDSTTAILKQLSPATSVGFGSENGPFSLTVDYDRRLRLRNSDTKKSILWSFPPPRSVVAPLRTDTINFLASGEKLVSPSGAHWISVNNQGVLVTSTGYAFNAQLSTATVQPLVLQVNRDGSLKLYDALGRVHPVPSFPVASAGQVFELQVTDAGMLQLLDALANTILWGFDITTSALVPITPTNATSTPPGPPTPVATPGNVWTSATVVQPGYNLPSAYDGSVAFTFFPNGDMGIQIGGATFNTRTALTGGVVDSNNMPALNLSAGGHLYLKDSKFNILRELTNPQSSALGETNGPFSLTVDFDRRLRLRNSDIYKTIVWSFPAPRTMVPSLDTSSISFLASGETIFSPSGKYSLSLTTAGVLTTSAGFAFNSNPQTTNPQPYVLVLNADGSLGLYDALGQLHPVQQLPGAAPARTASEYVLTVTDNGIIQVGDVLAAKVVWSFYITTSSTNPPSTPNPPPITPTSTVPPPPVLSSTSTTSAATPSGTWRALSDVRNQKCVTYSGCTPNVDCNTSSSFATATLQPCVANVAAQLWWWKNGRMISQIGGAVLCIDANTLAIATCSTTFNAWFNDYPNRLFKVNGNCLSNAGGILSVTACGATDGSQFWNLA
ncbi:hypothetical protein HK101_007590 [Irineochytrium annulatum]|nr:hypothetical protein HK101_007590 [Irineochytrium annulatum]